MLSNIQLSRDHAAQSGFNDIKYQAQYTQIYNNPNIQPVPNVFSFSLYHINNTSQAWKDRYLHPQIAAFNTILENNVWDDFGIVHLIRIDTYLLMTNTERAQLHALQTTHMVDHVTSRYKIYLYSYTPNNHAMQGNILVNIDLNPVWGSVVRFCPMIFPELNIVLVRDAHSTISNPSTEVIHTRTGQIPINTLDRQWINTWIGTGKQYFRYRMIGYQPSYNLGKHADLGATWGAQKTGLNVTIIPEATFHAYLFNAELSSSDAYVNSNYGTDELLLTNLFTNTDIDTIFTVGITHLLYMIFPQRRIDHNDIAYRPTDGPRDAIYCTRATSTIMLTNNFSNSARCVLYAVVKQYYGEVYPGAQWNGNIAQLFVKDIINIMGYARLMIEQQAQDGFLNDMIQLIPDARNLWNTLFNIHNLNISLLDYVNIFLPQNANITEEQLRSLCLDESFFLNEGDETLTYTGNLRRQYKDRIHAQAGGNAKIPKKKF